LVGIHSSAINFYVVSLGNILIIEDKPIYAACLTVQFERWGFGEVQVIASADQISSCLSHLCPVLILANLEIGKCRAILKAGCPVIYFKINDGSYFPRKQPKIVLKNYSRLNLPCTVEELVERVETVLNIRLPACTWAR
jgi:hypothetical protein